MTWVWAEPSTWKLWWLEGQFMVRDVGRRGRDDRRGLRGWLIMSIKSQKKIAQNIYWSPTICQALHKGLWGEIKVITAITLTWRLSLQWVATSLNTRPLRTHAQSAENLTSTSFYTKSTLTTHVASLCISPSSLLISIHDTERRPPKRCHHQL